MARELSPCGTIAAIRRHRRNGELIDDECRKAERAASRRGMQRMRTRRRKEREVSCIVLEYFRIRYPLEFNRIHTQAMHEEAERDE